jgi:hypothetical protein
VAVGVGAGEAAGGQDAAGSVGQSQPQVGLAGAVQDGSGGHHPGQAGDAGAGDQAGEVDGGRFSWPVMRLGLLGGHSGPPPAMLRQQRTN